MSGLNKVKNKNYNKKPPLERDYRSVDTLDRYNEAGLHDMDSSSATSEQDSCLHRLPYASIISTIMCIVGVCVFCSSLYKGAGLGVNMIDEVFHIQAKWMNKIKIAFTILGACMGAIGLIMLFVGFLSTGATRYQVYRKQGIRTSGRISCAIFIGVSYILHIGWIVMFVFVFLLTFCNTMFWYMCSSNVVVVAMSNCIDLTLFSFLFPPGTKPDDMKICGPEEIKLFCKDFVENAEPQFVMATSACFVVIMSLVHYMICMAANYAHITGQKNFSLIEELTYLKMDQPRKPDNRI